MKLDKQRKKKSNHITLSIMDMIDEHKISDKQTFLSDISSIICQLDTDIAIDVMENFGEEGKYESTAIKVNYGY
tara:strand:+ start:6456 stop:6677 length:222 start_codon:yes stop_codon:yes gene_type:complete